EQVAAGGLEEFHHRLVLEGRRIGEVDHHLGAAQRRLEALARDGVDTVLGRGGENLVAALAQNGDGLRADQPGAADDDDLHGHTPPCLVVEMGGKLKRAAARIFHGIALDFSIVSSGGRSTRSLCRTAQSATAADRYRGTCFYAAAPPAKFRATFGRSRSSR